MSKKILKNIAIIAGYLLLWQVLAILTSTWLLPGPIETIKTLIVMAGSTDFYITTLNTVFRIMGGFLAGFIFSLFLSVISYRFIWLIDVLKPFMGVMKSVPVACLTIIAIIWFGSSSLSFVVVMMVVMPLVYSQVLTALLETDKKSLEMCGIYRINLFGRIKAVYLDRIKETLFSVIGLSIGMSFKAGIAAELIGIVKHSIGEKVYLDKLYFDMSGVFSWVIVIMLVSFVSEKLFVSIIKAFIKRASRIDKSYASPAECSSELMIEGLSKCYGEKELICNFSLKISDNGIYSVIGDSGAGKTTFFDIIAGLNSADSGNVNLNSLAYAFQEPRLFMQYSAADNLVIVGISREVACEKLKEVGVDPNVISEKLSGGEKSRLEIIRALYTNSHIVLLDEPFAGLDDEAIDNVISVIKGKANEKIIIAAVHEETEAIRLSLKENFIYLR